MAGRRRSLVFLIIVLALSCGKPRGYGQDKTLDYDLSRSSLDHSNAALSLYTYQSLSKILPQKVIISSTELNFKQPEFDQATKEFGAALSKSKEQYERFERLNGHFDSAFELVEGAASPEDGDPRALVAKAGIRLWMNGIKEETTREVAETEAAASRQFWTGRQVNVPGLERAMKRGAPALTAEILAQSGMSDQVFEGLSPQRKEEAVLRLAKFAIGSQNAILFQQEKKVERSQQEINSLLRRIDRLENAGEALQQQMLSLAAVTRDNTKTLKTLSDNFAALERALYEQMPLEQQLRLAETSGAFGLSDEKRLQLVANLKQRQKLYSDIQDWNTFVLTGQTSLRLMNLIGVDKDFTRNFSISLSGINTAFQIGQLLGKGGFTSYLNAVSFAMNFLSSLGPDADQQRHQEIMQALQQIMQAIKQLRDEVYRYHEEEMAAIQKTQIIESHALQLQVAESEKELRNCDIFLQGIKGQSNRGSSISAYAQLAQGYQDYQPNFSHCQDYLATSLFPSSQNAIRLGIAVTTADTLASFDDITQFDPIEHTIIPLFHYIEYFMPESTKHKIWASLFWPAGDFDSVELKRTMIGQSDDSWTDVLRPYASPDPGFYLSPSLFRQIIDARHLSQHIEYELAINHFRELTKGDYSRLLTTKELLQDGGAVARAETVLKGTLDWLNLAIAQQRLLSGDVLIPYLAMDADKQYDLHAIKGWNFMSPLDEEQRKSEVYRIALAQHILATNPLIRQNTFRYIIFKTMRSKAVSSPAYTFAFITPSATEGDDIYTNMTTIFGDKFGCHYSKMRHEREPQGWSARIFFQAGVVHEGGAIYPTAFDEPFPSPEEVRHHAFAGTPVLDLLLSMRQRVIGRLMGFDIVSESSRTQLPKLKRFIAYTGEN